MHPFDSATFDLYWETEVYLELVDQTIRLNICAEADGPEPWQREAFDAFVAEQEAIRPRLQAALLAYYREIVGEYRERFSPESLNRAPLVSTYAELAKLLEPEALLVQDDIFPKPEIGLLFGCTWDPGHGVGVRVRNGEIVEVGSQDICL